MKTLGLIGGMSWESTQLYYRLINEGVRAELGGLHSASLNLQSVDFAPIEQMQAEGQWARAGAQLAGIAKRLEMAGADGVILCTNTMHKVAEPIADALSVPFLHIGDVTRAAIEAAGYSQVSFLGTRFTMDEPFMIDRLQTDSLRVDVPDLADREIINRVIFEELCRGKILEASRAEYHRIIQQLADQGAEAVVFGCTEIGMLVDPASLPIPCLDTTQLHADAAVSWMLSIKRMPG